MERLQYIFRRGKMVLVLVLIVLFLSVHERTHNDILILSNKR